MKAISLWQPWASALFAPIDNGIGTVALKQYETRSWPLPAWAVGVPIAIHAAQRETWEEREFWSFEVLHGKRRPFYAAPFAAIGVRTYADLPRGCVIGTVRFGPSTSVVNVVPSEIEDAWGNFSFGRYAWPVVESHHFDKPIPCVGRQKFFNVQLP